MPCSRCTAENRACTFDGGPSALLSSVSSGTGDAAGQRKRKPRRKSSRSPSRSPERKRRPGKREEQFHREWSLPCPSVIAPFSIKVRVVLMTSSTAYINPRLDAYLPLVFIRRRSHEIRGFDIRHAGSVSGESLEPVSLIIPSRLLLRRQRKRKKIATIE